MKNNYNTEHGSHKLRFHATLAFILTAMLITPYNQLSAQNAPGLYTTPSWWFGAAVAANGNFYRGTTHQLSADFKPPTAFHDGMGIGLYVAPAIEWHRADTRFGFMLQAGYDNRSGKFDQVITPCNCPADLSARLSYLTIEPSLRFAPFKKGLFLYAGPRFALNYTKEFTYKQGINPDYPEQVANEDVEGDFSMVNNSVISMQVGMGFDIPIISNAHQTQMMLSPFVAFHPYFGQDPRSIETWNITTFRAGAILKFGFGSLVDKDDKADNDEDKKKAKVVPVVVEEVEEEEDEKNIVVPVVVAAAANSDVKFSVESPANIPDKRLVRESFPLMNYVFFDLNSTVIPERYVLLDKSQVANFKEENVELFTPKNLSGRSDRQMVVYYNVLNILGKRMSDYPRTNVTLSGSSNEGQADGKVMAESIKSYLVNTFGISASRITTIGMAKPTIPSEQPGGTMELTRLRQEDRRVTIASNSPELVMEYLSGPDANLKPIEIVAEQTAPVESYVTFLAEGADKEFSSWRIEVKDDAGVVKGYGPFKTDEVVMPGKDIMGDRPKGRYKVTMIGTPKKNGPEVVQMTNVDMVLWSPSSTEVASKYSIIYGINESRAIAMYDKYIREVVVPAIPTNGLVIIHGYTDDIGDATNNKNLSMARALDVQNTIKSALAAKGRTDVRYTVYGFGENEKLALFNNKYPEERLYNRSVIVEIVPQK